MAAFKKKRKVIKIIVDANIVFSGILNSNGKIGDLLINSKENFSFIAPDFLRAEIRKHYARLSIISGLTVEQIKEAEFQICRDINFISEEKIKKTNWILAVKLTADIDPKDSPYIAFQNILNPESGAETKPLLKDLQKKILPILFQRMSFLKCAKNLEC